MGLGGQHCQHPVPATMASPVRGPGFVPHPALTPACSPVGWTAGMHRPPGSAWVQAGVPVGPVGLRHGGQHLPVPVAPHSVGGRLPFPAAGGDSHGAGVQLPARPRSKVSAVEAARGGSSVTCVGRFLRQHHTEGREPPAAPATSTAASRAPGTAGPWRAGFGNSAWRRGPAHGGQTSRQSRTSRRLLCAGKLPGEIWVKPPLPVPGRAQRAPAGIPCPCPAATAALTSLSLPCSPWGPHCWPLPSCSRPPAPPALRQHR